MANSLLHAKRILAVDDDPEVLTILEEEILMPPQAVLSTRPSITRLQ